MNNDKKLFKGQKNNTFITEDFIKKMLDRREFILNNPDKYNKLPPRMKKILKYRYALEDENSMFLSRSEISRKMKISLRRVYDIEKEAIAILGKKWRTDI